MQNNQENTQEDQESVGQQLHLLLQDIEQEETARETTYNVLLQGNTDPPNQHVFVVANTSQDLPQPASVQTHSIFSTLIEIRCSPGCKLQRGSWRLLR